MGSGTKKKKKMAKHASVTTHCPPLKYFDFTTNLPLIGMGEYTQGANDSLCPGSSPASIWASRNDFLRCDVIYSVLSLSKRQTTSHVTPDVCIMVSPAN